MFAKKKIHKKIIRLLLIKELRSWITCVENKNDAMMITNDVIIVECLESFPQQSHKKKEAQLHFIWLF